MSLEDKGMACAGRHIRSQHDRHSRHIILLLGFKANLDHVRSGLIERSNELPEVKAFLGRYPNATAHVEKGSDIMVAYTVHTTQSEIQDEQASTLDESTLMLVVFLARNGIDMKHVNFLCLDGESRREVGDAAIIGFLERGKARHCSD